MRKFNWGQVINTFSYDMDGKGLEVVKYHPWQSGNSRVVTGSPDKSKTHYHCEEISQSFDSLDAAIIAWIANKRLGLNQHALVGGVCRAIGVIETD